MDLTKMANESFYLLGKMFYRKNCHHSLERSYTNDRKIKQYKNVDI